jgi:amino acid transporter
MSKESRPVSEELRRVLTLSDLVLFNLVAVISLRWVSASVKAAGPGALVLWVAAAALFFLPQGLAVIELSSRFPKEGGIYSWTKLMLGEKHGFLCGWCYWINNVLYFPSGLIRGAIVATYVFGHDGGGLTNNWVYVLTFTLISLWLATSLNMIGVGAGKWLQNVGGISVYIPGLLLILLGAWAALTRPAANPLTFGGLLPEVSNLQSLNLWATIPFAYAGLELSATMGQEVQNPLRNLPLSYYIAAPLITLFCTLGSLAMLWLVPAAEINIAAAHFPAIAAGARSLGEAFLWLIPLAALCSILSRIGSLGAWLSGSARVAFVVGIDRYLPPAFGRLHPRWGTPYVAIVVQATLATGFLLLSVLGKGTTVEHSFLVLVDTALLLYFIPYVYLFVCFLLSSVRERSGSGVFGGRYFPLAVGTSGLLVTLFAMMVAMIPPPGTSSPWGFVTKVVGGAAAFLIAGGVIYWHARRNNEAPLPSAAPGRGDQAAL